MAPGPQGPTSPVLPPRPTQEHETQAIIEQMVKALNERAAMENAMWAQQMQTQQGVQELTEQEQYQLNEQMQQETYHQLMGQMLLQGGDRVPPDPALEEQMAQQMMGLPPEMVKVLQQTQQDMRGIQSGVMDFENQIRQIFQQSAAEKQAEEKGIPITPGGVRIHPGLLGDYLKSTFGGMLGVDTTRRGEITGQVRDLIERAKLEAPQQFPGLTPEAADTMLHQTANRVMEQMFELIKPEEGSRAWIEGMGHVASFLVPMKVASAATQGVLRTLPRSIATLGATQGTKLAAVASWVTNLGGMVPLTFAYRIGLPLSDPDKFWVEGQPEDQREDLEWAMKVYRSAQWSAMLPFYELAGLTGGLLGRGAGSLAQRIPGVPEGAGRLVGGVTSGYGTALALPDYGSIGDNMMKAWAEGTDDHAMLKAVLAQGQLQGPVRAIMGKIGTADAEEVWPDLLAFAKETAGSGEGVTFMALGMLHGMQFRWRRPENAEKPLKEALEDIEAREDMPEEVRQSLRDVVLRDHERNLRSEEETRELDVREEMEAEFGGAGEAREAVKAAVEAEEVPVPRGRKAAETTVEARRKAILEEIEEVESREQTPKTQQELEALIHEESAARLREQASKGVGDKAELEARAMALEETARKTRAGEGAWQPGRAEVERIKAEELPKRRVERELRAEAEATDIGERLVTERRAKAEAERTRKEPWQESYDEFSRRRMKEEGSKVIPKLPDEHRGQVERALKEGKEIPREVLTDYPDLAEARKAELVVEATKGRGPKRVGLLPEGSRELKKGEAWESVSAQTENYARQIEEGKIEGSPEAVAQARKISAEWRRKEAAREAQELGQELETKKANLVAKAEGSELRVLPQTAEGKASSALRSRRGPDERPKISKVDVDDPLYRTKKTLEDALEADPVPEGKTIDLSRKERDWVLRHAEGEFKDYLKELKHGGGTTELTLSGSKRVSDPDAPFQVDAKWEGDIAAAAQKMLDAESAKKRPNKGVLGIAEDILRSTRAHKPVTVGETQVRMDKIERDAVAKVLDDTHGQRHIAAKVRRGDTGFTIDQARAIQKAYDKLGIDKSSTKKVKGSEPDPESQLPKDAITKRKSHKGYVQTELFKEQQDAIDQMDGVKPLEGAEYLEGTAKEMAQEILNADVANIEAPSRPAQGGFLPGMDRIGSARLKVMEKYGVLSQEWGRKLTKLYEEQREPDRTYGVELTNLERQQLKRVADRNLDQPDAIGELGWQRMRDLESIRDKLRKGGDLKLNRDEMTEMSWAIGDLQADVLAHAKKRKGKGVTKRRKELKALADQLERRVSELMKPAAARDLERQQSEMPFYQKFQVLINSAKTEAERFYYEAARSLSGETPTYVADTLYESLKEFDPRMETDYRELDTVTQDVWQSFRDIRSKVIETNNAEFWERWAAGNREILTGPWSVAARYTDRGLHVVKEIDSFQDMVYSSIGRGDQGGYIYVPGIPVFRGWGLFTEMMRGGDVRTLDTFYETTARDPMADILSRKKKRPVSGVLGWSRGFWTALGNWGSLGKELAGTLAQRQEIRTDLYSKLLGPEGLISSYKQKQRDFLLRRKKLLKETSLDTEKQLEEAGAIVSLMVEAESAAAEHWSPRQAEKWENLDPKIKNDPDLKAAAKDLAKAMEVLRPLAAQTSGKYMAMRLKADEHQAQAEHHAKETEIIEDRLAATEAFFKKHFSREMERLDEISAELKDTKAEYKKENPEFPPEVLDRRVEDLVKERKELGKDIAYQQRLLNEEAAIEAERVFRESDPKAKEWRVRKAGQEATVTSNPRTLKRALTQEQGRARKAAKRAVEIREEADRWADEEFGYPNHFMHHITATEPTRGAEVDGRKLHDLLNQSPGPETLLRLAVDRVPERRQMGTHHQRMGELQDNRDLDASRSLLHYINQVAGVAPLNKFFYRTHERLFGKIRPATAQEILHPRSIKGGPMELIYKGDNYRSLGEHIKLTTTVAQGQEGTLWQPVRGMEGKAKAAFEASERARQEAAITGEQSDIPRVQRYVLLMRGNEVGAARLSDPAWVAEKMERGDLHAVPKRRAFTLIKSRTPGFVRQLAVVSPKEHGLFMDYISRVLNDNAEMMGTKLEGAWAKTSRWLTNWISNRVMGLLRMSSAMRAAGPAVAYNTRVLGPTRAVTDLKLPFAYLGILRRANLTGNVWKDIWRTATGKSTKAQSWRELLEYKVNELEDPTVFTTPMEARIRKAIMEAPEGDIIDAVGKREWFADAAVAWYKSGLLQGHRGSSYFVRHFARPGQKIAENPVVGGYRWLTDKGWIPFDAGESFVRAHAYLSSYMSYRATGMSAEGAAQKAYGLTVSMHGIFNKASKSAFLTSPLGQVGGAIMSWQHHWNGTYLRLPWDEKMKFWAYMQTLAMLAPIAHMSMDDLLGVSLRDTFGGIPYAEDAAKITSDRLRGIGVTTDADTLGIEPKGFLDNITPEEWIEFREYLVKNVRGDVPEDAAGLRATMARSLRLVMGDLSGMPMGPMMPIDPISLESPGTQLMERTGNFVGSIISGSPEDMEDATKRFLRELFVPGIYTDMKRAFGTEESEENPGTYNYRPPFQDDVSQQLQAQGIMQFLRDLRPGRDWQEQIDYYNRQLMWRRQDLERSALERVKLEGIRYMKQERLIAGMREEGEEPSAADLELLDERVERVKELAAEAQMPPERLRENLESWGKQFDLGDMPPHLSDIARISGTGSKVDELTRLLNRRRASQDEFVRIVRAIVPDSQIGGVVSFLEGGPVPRWLMDQGGRVMPQAIPFREAYQAARARWRER